MGHKISAQVFIDLLYIQMAPTEKGQQSTLECWLNQHCLMENRFNLHNYKIW